EALVRWSLPLKQPAACDSVFAWLHDQHAVTPSLAESRTRAALTAGNVALAREFAADLPPTAAAPLLQWLHLLETPKPALRALATDDKTPVDPEALEAGLNRLALSDSAAAAALLPQLLARPDVTPALRARLQRVVALGLGYDHAPAAVAAFADLPTEAITD